MPTSTPLLDALKVEKSAPRDKEAIERNHPHYKDAAQASKKVDSKKNAAATSGAASEANQGGNSSAPLGKGAAKRAAAAPGWLHDAAEDRKPIRCSTCCGQAISVLSEQGQVRAGRQASTRPKPPSTSPGQATSTAPSSSSPPSDSGTPITPAPAPSRGPASSDGSELKDGHSPCLDPPRGRSRWPSLVLPSRKATTGGSAHPKWRKGKEKERVRVKDGASSSERVGGGRRKEEGGRRTGAGWACYSPVAWRLIAPTVLQCESKQPQPHPSQQGPPADATARQCLSLLTCPPPQVMAMGDEAEE